MANHTASVIIGAGPYGLSAAAHLRGLGIQPHVIGRPMEFWKTQMPAGMLLRSPFEASNISAPGDALTLEAYARAAGKRIQEPVPLEDFVAYGEWFQRQVAPDADTRRVRNLAQQGDGFEIEFEDGDRLSSDVVVLALGIGKFAMRPEQFAQVPEQLAMHSSQLADPSTFRGQRVAVVGTGQSGLESAALLREHGADVQIIARAPEVEIMPPGWRLRLFRALTPGPLRGFSYAIRPPTGLGTVMTGRAMAIPEKFRRQPLAVQESLLAEARQPRGADWLRRRLDGVVVRTGVEVRTVAVNGDRLQLSLTDGTSTEVDRVILATGYQVDLARCAIFDPALLASIRMVEGYPQLSTGLETSVPGLYMAGVVGERTLGPTLRFVTGTSNAGPRLAASVAARLASAVAQGHRV